MSGGEIGRNLYWLKENIFDNGYYIETKCGFIGTNNKDYRKSIILARKRNAFNDKVVGELIYDVFNLLHSLDYYTAGDVCEEDYEQDLANFKNKWLKSLKKPYVKEIVQEYVEDLKKMLMIEDQDQEDKL